MSRILVVEDEPVIALSLCSLLEESGYEVSGPFARIDLAAEAIERESVDAALLDVRLDCGTSFPLADRLLGEGVPFLFLTAYGEDLPAPYRGVTALAKPVRRGVLLSRLRKAIAEAAPAPSLPV